jgi:hypothetical protein
MSFGNGTEILVSDFGFADLNGDGVINDLDIPLAVGIHSTAPVVPVPIPQVGDTYACILRTGRLARASQSHAQSWVALGI